MTDTAGEDSRRERALELARIQLGLRKASRTKETSPNPMEGWRLLGVRSDMVEHVRKIILDIAIAAFRKINDQDDTKASLDSLTLVKGALTNGPDMSLRAAVQELLRVTFGPDTAAAICELHAAGLSVIPNDRLPAVRCLARASLANADLDTLLQEWGAEWRLFADSALIALGLAPLLRNEFLSRAPVSMVDAYIDNLPEPPHPELWVSRPPAERRYLTARTRPGLLDDDDLHVLAWWAECHRRRYARGLPYQTRKDADDELYRLLYAATAGDVSVLHQLVELLPSDNANVIRQLMKGARSQDWPPELFEDRGLWLLMMRLWAPIGIIDPAQGAFQHWAAFRRAYDLTLERSFDGAWKQLNAFGQAPHVATPLQKEVINLRAYLTMIRSKGKELDGAVGLLRSISRAPAAHRNLEWLRRRKETTLNEREPAENPYLILGVDHGAPSHEWRASWRVLRSDFRNDLDLLSPVNEARDQILELERSESDGRGRVFVVPLDEKFVSPFTAEPSARLLPEPTVLPSRTDDLQRTTEIEELRMNALHELLASADENNQGS